MTGDEYADMAGKILALRAGLVALMRASESPALSGALERELEKSWAALLATRLPEAAMEGFERYSYPMRVAVGLEPASND